MPLWSDKDRYDAFAGALAAGNITLMNQFVKDGIDPHKRAIGDYRIENPYVSAAEYGAPQSIRWLAHAGVEIDSADDAENVWSGLALWAQKAPPELSEKRAVAWLAQRSEIHYAPGAKLRPSKELKVAAHDSSLLAKIMPRHGYHAEDLDQEGPRTF